MIDERTTLQTVAALHGLILAWETDEGVIEARYDYAVPLRDVTARDGVVGLRCTLVSDRDCEALLEPGGLRGIRATLNGALITDGSPRIEPFGCTWPVALREGANELRLEVTLAEVNTRFMARLIAPDRSPLEAVTEVRPHWHTTWEEVREEVPVDRDLSLWHQWNELCNRPPAMRLEEQSEETWRTWHERFNAALHGLMGPMEPLAELEPQVISSEQVDGYRRDRIVFRSERGVDVPAWLLVPDEPNGAGIVTIHGHSYVYGESIGVARGEASRERIRRANYAFGAAYAERGYTVINPDMRNFGARRDDEHRRRDACDLAALRLQQFGINLVARQILDLRACINLLCDQPTVDPERIGATGLSYGGRLTMYMAALDERVACAVASGSLNTFRERLTIDSSCAAQFVPGMLALGDTPEVFGLIAPRPLLLELGTVDGTSPEVFAMEAYAQIERIYEAAGVRERLDLDVFETGHKYHGVKAFDWFDRWLLH